MRLGYTRTALRQLGSASSVIRKAFYKQAGLLLDNLHHPSLHAKKYDESRNVWQARVNRDWRFYFVVHDDTYVILPVIAHPK
jgi:mRNA interferase RelE/StbE